MNQLQLFLPCAAGVEELLAHEVHHLTGLKGQDLLTHRGGVLARASWRDVMLLNLHGRLAQRVLVQLSLTTYRSEKDLYEAASAVAWEIWFTTWQTFKIEVTAQHSPLTSLNFAALKIKDAVADRFRQKTGVRPDVNTQWPDVRIYAHLTTDTATLYIDTSGEPLFKRGWREDKGDAPLKETLAAAMIAASGWDPHGDNPQPLYDPCCGSGTIVVEQSSGRVEASVLIKGFLFDKSLMQEHFNENYMESSKFPKASFKGKIDNLSAVNFGQDGTYNAQISGDLTMHGVTKPVTLSTELSPEVKDPWGKQRRGIVATGKLNRKDFGLGWNKALEAGGVAVGEEIQLTIEAELTKAAAPAAAPAAEKPAAPVKEAKPRPSK